MSALGNVNAIISLALEGVDAILSLIAEIKGQTGLSDDAILAQAQATTGANSTLYQTLVAALAAQAAATAAAKPAVQSPPAPK